MSTHEILPLSENLNIYANLSINLETLQHDMDRDNMRPFHLTQKPLSQLVQHSPDTISLVILETQADLEQLPAELRHCIIIMPDRLPIPSGQLSHAIVYKQAVTENHQQVLDKIFQGLVRFCFSTDLFIDQHDMQQALAFAGRHCLNIHCYSAQHFSKNQDVKAFFNQLAKDTALMVNLSLSHASYSMQTVLELLKQVTRHLDSDFEGDVFYSCIVSSKPEDHNLIYLNFTTQ